MSPDEIAQRLAVISRDIEQLLAQCWCLERERDELRFRLRAINAAPAKQDAA